jgi:CBS domain containing-hemolysin-like protein
VIEGTALLLLALLLAGNAFFVGAEFAMVSARRDQIEPKAATGAWTARWALKGMEDVSTSLAATQLGITACSLLIGAVGEPAIAPAIEGPLTSVGVPVELIHPIALLLALLIVTFLHMVLGEMVPKNMAIVRPVPSALILGPALRVFVMVFRPVIWTMNHSANLVVRWAFKAQPRDEVASAFTSEEVRGFIAESGREGLLDEDEIALLTGALDFESLTAADVAIPADQLRTVYCSATVTELEKLCVETGFSRFPVQGDDGSMVGYVHVKDILSMSAEHRHETLPAGSIRPLVSVPRDAKLRPVMQEMQKLNAHLALIEGTSNPVGGICVVALEDVLEELVGEVRDATSSRG